MTEHYMRLLTDTRLNDKQKNIWFRMVEKFLGATYSPRHDNFLDNMTSNREELQGDDDYPYVYVVYLSHDVDASIAEQIVYLWSEIYPRDFEIESSAEYPSDCGCECNGCDCDNCECNGCECNDVIEIDDEMHIEIQRKASKFLHNRWVDNQIHDGWAYGLYFDRDAKTSPKIRDWDTLHQDYRVELPMDRTQAIDFLKKFSHLFV